ncbi:sugar ABC transporter ATP-binding protein [Lichenihabitans sp. Uapishka_5]|uniref:sugar ABC transporter ATP-binding protein n=1 Tax=Lichenihabitans sp. Uapishka_5 TaxID=3037302 RepID=UPI0029E82160|nr:sugar ABC transporter ATP-binding protein [Lichenihabitans sp. Uapishka_5]MDX7953025.1 sugar ABC transporter ATP-binding protein [Lichenihabitans sp. Uapishka_5]
MPDDALRFEDVAKSFGGTRALKGVSFSVARGEIVALLGENGAGKSTLIKTLGGIYRADAGRVAIGSEPYRHQPSGATGRQPVAFIHQDLGLIEWMTVAENVGLSQGYPRRAGLGRLRPIDWRAAEATTARALATVGCDIDPTTRVSSLSRTEKSLVAIARALAVECDFLVLDEPTASLPADEVERLFDAMRKLKAGGVGMIYVSHRLDEVFRIADRVVVMRDGGLVGDQPVAAATPDGLVQLIIGRSELELFQKPQTTAGRTRVTVETLRTPGAGPVSFAVREGELLGLVGLRGAGQEEVGRALFGALPHTGAIRLDGEAPDLSSPRAALASGIGLIARDRTEESIAAALSIRENCFLNPGASGRGLFSVRTPREEAQAAAALGSSVGLRPNDPHLAIEGLSGGNQQKVIVGRWLATGRRLLIAEDPTAGVDIGARADIYRLIGRALERGLAVVVVSTDFEEVAHICQRALVFSHGRIVAELAGDALTTASLITAASTSKAA